MALTRKQQTFVSEYLQCWNASEAARRAAYSERTAPSQGQRLLKNVEVAAEIERQIADKAIKPAEVLERLTLQARADIGAFFKISERWTPAPLASEDVLEEREGVDGGGNPVREYRVQRVVLDLNKLLDPEYSRAVREFAESQRGGLSIKLHDSQAALEKLGKALGVLRENVNVTSEGSLEVVTRIVRKVADAKADA